MATEKELEQRIRESGGLTERLDECRTRIGKMCSERRPPAMTIPVQWYDDDFFMDTTIKDAIAEIKKLEYEIETLRRFGNKDCTSMADEHLEDHPYAIEVAP